jgi:hypothetical protein
MDKNINHVRPQGVFLSHGIWRHGLSLKATGLLCLLLDLKSAEDWEPSLTSIVELARLHQISDGRDSIRTAIAELESKGFLSRQRERDGNGTLTGTQWHISDQPVFSK